MKLILSKNKKDKCAVAYCRNDRGKNRRICYKHVKRKLKESDPERYHYFAFKNNAKRRGKDFSLTLGQYRELCQKYNLINNKGKKKSSLTIDRIDSSKGYSIDNIQVLTLSENSKKGNSDIYDGIPF